MLVEAWIIWLIPLLTAFIAFFVSKLNKNVAGYLSIISQSFVFLLSLSIAYRIIAGEIHWNKIGEHYFYTETAVLINWRAVYIDFGILIDPFSVIMLLVVSLISLLIFVYSLGYMEGEEDLGRYWFWMNFFVGSMLLLVVSVNLIQMFVAWEMVGLCSWALISFWYKKETPSDVPGFKTEGEYNAHCGFKALITTGFADSFTLVALGIIGIATLSVGKMTFNIIDLSTNPAWLLAIANLGLSVVFPLLLISGSLGKSAQFPYHEWLPEAMAGPTTVSALIHAATMVKAGAYFVGRVFLMIYDLHSLGTVPLEVMANFFNAAFYLGLLTAFLAGLYGIVAKELKKVLAFSTISQLSYIFMMFGLAGMVMSKEAFIAGVSHIITHAIFKALLFLCAGAILHAVHSKYMDEMGGLRRYMPITFWTMIIGSLSLVGIPLFAGYWSKELMFHEILMMPTGIVILFILTFLLTGVYTFRMIGLVFFGGESKHVNKIHEEHGIGDPPRVMSIPLIVLAALTILTGIFIPSAIKFIETGEFTFEANEFTTFITKTIISTGTLVSLITAVVSISLTFPFYFKRIISPEKIIKKYPILRLFYKMLYERWILNPIYYWIVKGLKASIRFFKAIDDGINVIYSAISKSALIFSQIVRRLQTGDARINAFYMMVAILSFLIILLYL